MQYARIISKRLLQFIGILLLFLLLWLGYLLASEYKPEPLEQIELEGRAAKTLTPGQSFSIVSWNMGYGGLDATVDFFMDGGQTVNPPSKAHVQNTTDNLAAQLYALQADVYFLQEIDRNSRRSYHIDQAQVMQQALEQLTPVQSAFAYNFHVKFIPYPVPPIGQTHSGLLTLNSFSATEATRIGFPSSFQWPVSAFQLKRCLLLERIPLEHCEKELVLINLHLEAYDNGEGKAQQAAQLAQVMQEEYAKGNYVIAGGDFNSMLPSVDINKYPLQFTEYFQPAMIEASLLPDGWQYVTDDSVPTSRLLNHPYDAQQPDNNQYYVIDGFILSPNVTLEQVETLDYQFQYSDHNPVQIQVTLQS